MKVGVMALAAMAILAVLLYLLTGSESPFESHGILYTYMSDSAALAEASPVRLNGILIGKVKKVALSGDKQPRRIIRIEMEIDDKFFPAIPVDSVASISAENLLSGKYINIKAGTSRTAIRPGQELPSLDAQEFQDLVQQGFPVLASLQDTLAKVNAIVAQVEVGKGSIGKLLVDEELYNRFLAITKDVQQLTDALNSGKGLIGKLIYDDALYNDVRGLIARLDAVAAGVQQGQGTAGKFLKDPALYDEMHKTVAELHTLLADLNAGKGSAGKLLKSDDLHNQAMASIAKVDSLIDKMNSGQGTIGQLLVNPQLYESLNGTTRELHGLLEDFHKNPKKFLQIKLGLF